MKQEKQTVNFIALIVILTIGIQIYWNYIQYANNRIQVINEIQSILEEVLSNYTKEHTLKSKLTNGVITSEMGNEKSDSIKNTINNTLKKLLSNNQLKINTNGIEPIAYTLIQDSLNLVELDKNLLYALQKKNYNLDYNLVIIENEKVKDSIGPHLDYSKVLVAQTQLMPIETSLVIRLNYYNPILPSLLKGLTGIILSFLLCSIIIFALYYLLHIIQKQKKLSEIKNDFISNVTHEFKTPITTISSAIEAIKNFNNEQISEKTKRYLDISEQQLKKLNLLVEKVMETSLLESTALSLDKQKTDIIELLKACTEKHKLNTIKNIQFETSLKNIELDIDEFHFENAISNLIDNAIKYGGHEIKISIYSSDKALNISIQDNGEGISKEDEPYIFDKFYRVKNKTIYTIKGNGIGLYYTKNIIQKHNGTIQLKNRNTFLITLWTK